MPIFEKGGNRVYFCHIPKTAGSHVYLLFVANGWRLLNYSFNPKRGTSRDLYRLFGIEQVEQIGEVENIATSLQHVTRTDWEAWGPFSESFAITRHPVDRYVSAVRYRYGLVRNREESLDAFRDTVLKKLKRKLAQKPGLFDGHFLPQSDFIATDTRLFRFEEPWESELTTHFALDPLSLPPTNPSMVEKFIPSGEELGWIEASYREDFIRFNYRRALP